jgi:hypothetical protein
MAGTSERRRHVRLKPSPELPARAALVGEGPLREAVDVVDVSLGGLALSSPAFAGATLGSRMKLTISLDAGDGRTSEHVVDVVTRWVRAEIIGVELTDASEATMQALGHYVGELLERGASS